MGTAGGDRHWRKRGHDPNRRRPGGAETERTIAGNSVFDAPKIIVSRVDVEGARATEVDAICHELPEECPVDALLGLSFLTRFNVGFDFDAWEMELVPRA